MPKLNIDTLRVCPDRILVKRSPLNAYAGSAGIIINPGTAYVGRKRCEVVKAGKRILANGDRVESELKPGDIISVLQYDGEVVDEIHHPDLAWIRYEHIVCRVTDPEAEVD